MTVPVLWVLERHPGVLQKTVLYATCFGSFQRLKALEKIHFTRNFRAPSQWRWKRKHLKEYINQPIREGNFLKLNRLYTTYK